MIIHDPTLPDRLEIQARKRISLPEFRPLCDLMLEAAEVLRASQPHRTAPVTIRQPATIDPDDLESRN